jgi:excisionase family DNA binding protein
MNDVLTLTEAEKKVRVHRNTLVRYFLNGTIPAWKVGRSWRVRECHLEALFQPQNTGTEVGTETTGRPVAVPSDVERPTRLKPAPRKGDKPDVPWYERYN